MSLISLSSSLFLVTLTGLLSFTSFFVRESLERSENAFELQLWLHRQHLASSSGHQRCRLYRAGQEHFYPADSFYYRFSFQAVSAASQTSPQNCLRPPRPTEAGSQPPQTSQQIKLPQLFQ